MAFFHSGTLIALIGNAPIGNDNLRLLMYASKEMAKAANERLEKVAKLVDVACGNPGQRDDIKRLLMNIQAFIEAAHKKLPREASYFKDRKEGV